MIKKIQLSAIVFLTGLSIAQPVTPEAPEAPAAPAVVAPVAAPVTVVVEAPVAVAVVAEAPVAEKKSVEPLAVVTPGGTKVQIYGRLELNSAYEDGLTGDGKDARRLWTGIAPKNANQSAQGRTSLSIARTRLGLNLTGPSKEGEPELSGRFEADFSGSDNYSNFNGSSGFRVRQSWGAVKYKDLGLTLLFGQTEDLISPLDPPSINPSSLNGAGNIGHRRPQIRITQALGPVELAVAATHDRLVATDTVAPSTPGIQARLGTKLPATWAGEKANLALGISGHYSKNEPANDDNDERAERPPESYSFNVDLSLPVVSILTLTGEFFTGQNLRRFADGSLKLSPPKSDTKDSSHVQSIGWWGALAAKLPANFGAAAGIGMETIDEDSRQKDKVENSTFIFANVSYNFTSAAKLTFEYLNLASDWTEEKEGKLKTSDDKGHLNRFELNFRYDFK